MRWAWWGLLISFQATISVAQQLVIKDQRELRIEQGGSITVGLGDITVEADRSLNYPNGFYLEIDDDRDYHVSGTTVTPSAGFDGRLKVKIRVTNGEVKSNKFQLRIQVGRSGGGGGDDDDNKGDGEDDKGGGNDDDDDKGGGNDDDHGDGDDDDNGGGDDDDEGDDDDDNGNGNDTNQKPSIISQTTVNIDKNQSFTIRLSHLVVSDPDNDYPDDFNLKVQGGDNYGVEGTTITPKHNFVGTLTIKVRVNDGKANSEVFHFQITVKDVVPPNAKPVITAQTPISIFKDESVTLKLTHLSVTDTDDNYPSDFTLTVLPGSNYSISGHTITPSAGFVGTATVKVRVNDGKVDSDIFDFQITIKEVVHSNTKPVIIAQAPLSIFKNEPVTLKLTQLSVTDPDDNYPSGFTLTLLPGTNYSVSGLTITPSTEFVGILTVRVRVNDGKADSDVFELQITVKDVAQTNAKPVITAQAPLSTFKNEPITLKLTDLSVTDPDDSYPADFTLTVLTGANYTGSGRTITPTAGYSGALTVKVKVHDGHDDSNIFDLKINVLERGTLQIVGQNSIIILEDSAYMLRLSDLKVSDPTNQYPVGFKLSIVPGNNYTIEGQTIRPGVNFHGNLTVPLKVVKGAMSSKVFEALVIVRPVNDPPAFAAFDTASIAIRPFAEIPIAKEFKTSDVDNNRLTFAEAELDSANALTYLEYLSSEKVRGIFDQNNGVLVFLGDASLEAYDRALRSITYTSSDSTTQKRTIRFRLNDGEAYSNWHEKALIMTNRELTLDIPTAFTPNNDNANDTWVITLLQDHSQTELDLKVYNRRGVLLFETDSFERPWDGKFNGELLPADNYFFTLEVKTLDRKARRKGIVALLR